MRYFLFFLILFNQIIAFGQRFDYASDTLHAVWGKENITAKSDLSAKVKINSQGDKIMIEVEVMDDKTIVKTLADQSDHLELWLSLPIEKSEDSLSFINSEFENIPPAYYYQYDTTDKDHKRYRFFSINSEVDYPNISKQKSNVYYGIVHYGLFPDNRQVEMFDKEKYVLLDKALGEKIGHVHQGIKYKAEPTKTGVKYSITITPLGLGFVKVPEMNKELMRLDVIDVDAQKESVISTSRAGGTFSYDDVAEVKFSKPFKTNITTVPNFIFDTLRFSPAVMFTDKGYWSGISRNETCLNNDSCSIKEIAFMRTPFGYKKIKLGNKEIIKFMRNTKEFLSDNSPNLVLTTEEIYFINENRYTSSRNDESRSWEFRDLKKEFLFPDGSQGLILINVVKGSQSDSCKDSIYKDLKIVKVKERKSEVIFSMVFDECKKSNLIGDQNVGEVMITNVKWIKEGESIQIICERLDNHQPKKFRVDLLKNNKVRVVDEKEKASGKRK